MDHKTDNRKKEAVETDGAIIWKPADYDWMDKQDPLYEKEGQTEQEAQKEDEER